MKNEDLTNTEFPTCRWGTAECDDCDIRCQMCGMPVCIGELTHYGKLRICGACHVRVEKERHDHSPV